MGTERTASFVVDAAQYIIEPPDLWSSRVASKHKELAPKVVTMPDGDEGWSYEDGAWFRPLGLEVSAGHSPTDIRDHGYDYDSIRKGMYDAQERLNDMRIDGIEVASIFPTYGLDVRGIDDPELHIACVQAYNDGVLDWAKAGDQNRLVPHALIPAVGLDPAMAELNRVAKLGYKGIVFSGWPAGGAKPQAAEDAFWAFCAEAGMVIDLIRGGPVGADRTPMVPQRYVGKGSRAQASDPPLEMVWTQAAATKNINIAWFVLTGILERHPGLQLALIDAGAGWLPTCCELIDWNYRYAQFLAFAKLKDTPGDYIRRHVKATVRNERNTVESRADVGVKALMWSSSYPNSTSSWPSSRLTIEDEFGCIPDDERRRILGENCAELYGLPVPTAA